MRWSIFMAAPSPKRQRFEPERMEHSYIVFRVGIRRGEQFFADKERVRTGDKTKSHGLPRERPAPRAQANHRCWHEVARGGDGAPVHQGIERLLILKRCPGNTHQRVD